MKTINMHPVYQSGFKRAVWIDGGGFVVLKKVTGDFIKVEFKKGKIIVLGTTKKGKLTKEVLDLSKIKFVSA